MTRPLERISNFGSTAENREWATPFIGVGFWDDLELDNEPDEFKDVLIVEDDSTTIKLFKAMIQNSDDLVRIKSVNSAEEAERYLAHLRRNQLPGPDAAIVDYNLSGKDGLYVCKLLESFFPLTKVVVVSGMSSDEVHDKLEQEKLRVEFIPKPLNRRQITGILRE